MKLGIIILKMVGNASVKLIIWMLNKLSGVRK